MEKKDFNWPDFTVTKIEAASSQLETAVVLWFGDHDPVSIHMLAAGAHQICHKIAATIGVKSPIYFNDSFLSKEDFKEYKKYLLYIEGFFKHADPKKGEANPHLTLTFKPMISAFYMLDGIELFHAIGGRLRPSMWVFRFWMSINFPGIIGQAELDEAEENRRIELGKLSKVKFLEGGMSGAFVAR